MLTEERVKREMGLRFYLFRKAIKKSREVLAQELNTSLSNICDIESGQAYPGILLLYALFSLYSLNLNWLTLGKGLMFNCKSPYKESYAGLFDSMKVPCVERMILEELTKAKKKFNNHLNLPPEPMDSQE